MGFSLDDKQVEANVFNDTGKWKYTVQLDYSVGRWDSYDLWFEAALALKVATLKGTSGVTFSELPKDWIMVVLEPYAYNTHPIMVKGGQDFGRLSHLTDDQKSHLERLEKSALESGRERITRGNGSIDWLSGR